MPATRFRRNLLAGRAVVVIVVDVRTEIAVWRAATGMWPTDRSLPGPVPDDDREAAYQRQLQRRVVANHSEALKIWECRIVEHTRRYDEQTTQLAKQLDKMARQGVDAGRALDSAASRKSLPFDLPTAALAYRVNRSTDQTKQESSIFGPHQRSPQPDNPQPGAVGQKEAPSRRYDGPMSEQAPARAPLSGPTGQRVVAHRGELREVLRRHGVANPEVFGSTARGDDHEGSDVDILVDFPPGTSIIDIIGIQHELEDLLGVHVDLVPRNGLKERVRVRAAKDLIAL